VPLGDQSGGMSGESGVLWGDACGGMVVEGAGGQRDR
jgi:hypothetical protein